jgi:DNA-directed RNA polymerase specialized sigma24 family protein
LSIFTNLERLIIRRAKAMMHGASKSRIQEPMPYATPADFCRIFESNMNRLYLLSYLLTGDHKRAERCFVGGLETSRSSNPVFKEWAESWARRMIIRNAIQMIGPAPAEAYSAPGSLQNVPQRAAGSSAAEPAEIEAVVELPVFERFVFVISVLEGYSDQECSLLLDCNRSDVVAARSHALQQIGAAAQLRQKVTPIDVGEPVQRSGPAAALDPTIFSAVAASA